VVYFSEKKSIDLFINKEGLGKQEVEFQILNFYL